MEFDQNKLESIMESLLLVSRHPLSEKAISDITGVSINIISQAFEALVKKYEQSGIKVLKVAGGFQLATAIENAEFVDKILNSPQEVPLTKAALETLSIIAYKQPLTKQEVEEIRGVLSDSPLETLLKRCLIAEVGRSDAVGRPILYATTAEFLQQFGLKDLQDLPALPEEIKAKADAIHTDHHINQQMEIREEIIIDATA